jgi:hypothetical protein
LLGTDALTARTRQVSARVNETIVKALGTGGIRDGCPPVAYATCRLLASSVVAEGSPLDFSELVLNLELADVGFKLVNYGVDADAGDIAVVLKLNDLT